jgi:hypothetical protein
LELLDGTTAQCTIVFRTDGAILLTSGGPAGTVLDTYTGAFSVTNTWYAFEIEVTINNTTGSWAVRKNGNTSNDHSLGSLDTQNSANAYANKLIFSMNTNVTQQQIDDLFWQSGASTGTWLGDIRCYTRMPASDASVQFTQGPNPVTQTIYVLNSSQGGVTTNWYIAFVPSFTGTISAAMISLFGGTANSLKMAIFDNSNGGNPGIALG